MAIPEILVLVGTFFKNKFYVLYIQYYNIIFERVSEVYSIDYLYEMHF